MSVLDTYVVYSLNSLDADTLYTVHEQDSAVAKHERQATCVLLLACYTACNMINAYIAHV